MASRITATKTVIRVALNESFWAGLFASENIILWEPSERAFYAYNAETGHLR